MSELRNGLKFATALAGGVLMSASLAHAAGFQLKEQGAGVQGLSFAGATAKADDLSTLFFNPAGMSRLDGEQAELNLSYIAPSAEFTPTSVSAGGANLNPVSISDGDGGDAGQSAIIPSVYGMYQIDDRTRVGLSINTPFGLSTEYDDGWAGRYHALKSEVMTVAVSPMVSYQATEKLSVGAGPVIQYVEGTLTKAVNVAGFFGAGADGLSKVEADDIGYGLQAGMLYEFSDNSRVGLAYRSQVRHRLEGNIKLTNVPAALGTSEPGHMKLITPDVVSIGGYHAFNDQWAVLADVAWTNWSTFNEVRIIGDTSNTVRELVREEWDDTFFVALGTEYKPVDDWTLQFGVAYDQSPIKDEFRTFRIPDSDRVWLSAGVGYELNENFSFNLAYTHIIADDVSVTQTETTSRDSTVTGDYDASVDIVAVNLSYKF